MVLAIVDDLFFAAKIRETARQSGITVEIAAGEQQVMDLAATRPSLVVIDLNCNKINPLQLIGRLKGDPGLAGVPILGFVSHVQDDLEVQARQAGCDTVLPRSAFSQNLAKILRD